MTFWPLINSDFPTDHIFHQFHYLYTERGLHRIMSGFHGAFATDVASQQGTLTLQDTWSRPPLWDLLVLQLLKPDSSNLPCLYSLFRVEHPLVISRFCSIGIIFSGKTFLVKWSDNNITIFHFKYIIPYIHTIAQYSTYYTLTSLKHCTGWHFCVKLYKIPFSIYISHSWFLLIYSYVYKCMILVSCKYSTWQCTVLIKITFDFQCIFAFNF